MQTSLRMSFLTFTVLEFLYLSAKNVKWVDTKMFVSACFFCREFRFIYINRPSICQTVWYYILKYDKYTILRCDQQLLFVDWQSPSHCDTLSFKFTMYQYSHESMMVGSNMVFLGNTKLLLSGKVKISSGIHLNNPYKHFRPCWFQLVTHTIDQDGRTGR